MGGARRGKSLHHWSFPAACHGPTWYSSMPPMSPDSEAAPPCVRSWAPVTEKPTGHPLLTASYTRTSPEGGNQPFSKTLQKTPKRPSSSKRTFCHDENNAHVCCPTG
ncbi:hypothetical protein I79_025661 [Cricetulus griseus]|uniref:Uncharacterized protein n=1 Tax=Cricetulus griseus TaxID=10029 RepID=G3INW6_CRIGR|nr:hypothetical protein I79_025661 [Cricetulus griseus]